MSSPLNQVKEFHEKFGLPVAKEPQWIGMQLADLRINLIREEAQEAVDEMASKESLRAVAKELADILYVVYGAALCYGFDLDEAFDAVHASNMTKLWPCDRCSDEIIIGCSECDGTGLVVNYREDGKVLKPETYTPADLSFIEEPE